MRIHMPAALFAAAPILVSATEPLHLRPTSPWVLNYGEDRCELSRVFGEGEERTGLSFQSESPRQLDMAVAGKPLSSNADFVPARFVPVQATPITGLPGRSSNGDPAIVWSSVNLMGEAALKKLGLDAEEAKAKRGERPKAKSAEIQSAIRAERQYFIANATVVEIVGKRKQPVILETGSLLAPINELDHCVKDSLSAWGVDPKLEEKIVRPVWPIHLERWFSSSDYPASMLRNGAQSQVHVRLLVDASGNPTHCTTVSRFKDSLTMWSATDSCGGRISNQRSWLTGRRSRAFMRKQSRS